MIVDGPGGGPDGVKRRFGASVQDGRRGSWLSAVTAGSVADPPEATQMELG